MKEVEIQLESRGNIDNRLVRVGDETSNQYRLDTKFNYRVGFEGNPDDGNYIFIDPAGGPFMAIGSEIKGHKIKAIRNGGIIEFES